MARPRKNIEDKKLIQVNARFTLIEYEKLNDLAVLSGLTIPEFVRQCSLNKRILRPLIHPVNRELLVLLSRYYNSIITLTEKNMHSDNDKQLLSNELHAVLRLLHEVKLYLIKDDRKTN